MMKKGQAAMEFLMTYGWAILVVLVAIGALVYLDVFNIGKRMPSACIIAPGIHCNARVDASLGSVQMILTNGLGEDVTNVDVAIGVCTIKSTEADGNDAWNSGTELGGSDGISLTGCTTGTANSRFKEDVTITYIDAAGLSRTKTGTVSTNVEP